MMIQSKTAMARTTTILLSAVLLAVLFPRSAHSSSLQTGTIYRVNTTSNSDDGTCNAAHCSLREAINAANASAGPDTIAFNISGTGVKTISAFNPSLPTITDPVVIDGSTQPGYAGTPLIFLHGAIPDTLECSSATVNTCAQPGPGLIITAGNSTVRGLGLVRFNEAAILLKDGGGNVIAGNIIGLDATGEQLRGNYDRGIKIDNSPNNRIGGTNPGDRNVIADNGTDINIEGGSASGNVIQGNIIGMNAAATKIVSQYAIWIDHGSSNVIGGTTPGARNLIASYNIAMMIGGGYNAKDTVVQGNWFGLTASGQPVREFNTSDSYYQRWYEENHYFGKAIFLNVAENTLIGGTEPGAGNIFGSAYYGIQVDHAVGTRIQGNRIGSTPDGMTGIADFARAIYVYGTARNTQIGGTEPGAGNLIASAYEAGILVFCDLYYGRCQTPSNQTVIQGNRIGTNITGGAPMKGVEQWHGIHIIDMDGVIVGGEGSAGNIIAFHLTHGVHLRGTFAKNNRISGNSIFGNNGMGHDKPGIFLQDSANENQPYPQLASAALNGTSMQVAGTLTSAASTAYRLEFFANPACAMMGRGEGKRYLGAATVSTNAMGSVSFTVSVPAAAAGEVITATATSSQGTTSEFSNCVTVGQTGSSTPAPTATHNMPMMTPTPQPTTAPGSLSAPLLIAPTNGSQTGTKPTFQWQAVSGADRYRLYLATDSGFTNVISNQSVTTTSYTRAYALTVGNTYWWKVRAGNAAGSTSPWSEARSFTVGATPLPSTPTSAPTHDHCPSTVPSGVTARRQTVQGDAHTLLLEWEDISALCEAVQRYKVYAWRSTYHQEWVFERAQINCSGTICTAVVTFDPNQSAIYWRVAAINAIGEGASDNSKSYVIP